MQRWTLWLSSPQVTQYKPVCVWALTQLFGNQSQLLCGTYWSLFWEKKKKTWQRSRNALPLSGPLPRQACIGVGCHRRRQGSVCGCLFAGTETNSFFPGGSVLIWWNLKQWKQMVENKLCFSEGIQSQGSGLWLAICWFSHFPDWGPL